MKIINQETLRQEMGSPAFAYCDECDCKTQTAVLVGKEEHELGYGESPTILCLPCLEKAYALVLKCEIRRIRNKTLFLRLDNFRLRYLSIPLARLYRWLFPT